MIISTRESKAVREKVIRLGVSQISGASRTSVGGYCEPEPEDENSEQFDVSDKRTLDEVVHWLMDLGYIPSFCTACYREGRTGDRFMSLCKSCLLYTSRQPLVQVYYLRLDQRHGGHSAAKAEKPHLGKAPEQLKKHQNHCSFPLFASAMARRAPKRPQARMTKITLTPNAQAARKAAAITRTEEIRFSLKTPLPMV